jgi:hypothetical protein
MYATCAARGLDQPRETSIAEVDQALAELDRVLEGNAGLTEVGKFLFREVQRLLNANGARCLL